LSHLGGSMNIQMSPRLQSLPQLRDPLVDLIYKVVCDVRNTSDFKPCLWDCLWFTAAL